jgi:DNA-binding transcriptional LysR family regulator
MDQLECMKSFVRTVETGSFSAVAREMNTTQPTISKQIAALEEYLDVQLLTRSTRSVNPTEAGNQFYQHCQRVLETVAEAEASVGQRQHPSGLLRISCPVAFGQYQIVPHLPQFYQRFPNIKIDLMMADQFVDLVEEGIDLAIRIGTNPDNTLISHRIGMTRRVTIGTVAYFATRGEPQTPADLANHNCIVYTRLSTGNEWHFAGSQGLIKVNVGGNFQTNSSAAVRQAVLSDLGIAVAPVWLFGDLLNQAKLRVVLNDYQPPPLPIDAVYRRSRFVSAKVRCWINFLSDQFKPDPWVSADQ